MPGNRQVSCGLSDSTVPMPTRMASLCARIWNTRVRAASLVIAHRLAAGEPDFAVGRNRQLERHDGPRLRDARDVPDMHAARLVGTKADIDGDAFARSSRGPGRPPPDWGLRSAETTRAMPALMMASAQGGVLP